MSRSSKQIDQIINLSGKLIELADHGFSRCEDEECLLLFSLVRDCAYRMKLEAEHVQQVFENLSTSKINTSTRPARSGAGENKGRKVK